MLRPVVQRAALCLAIVLFGGAFSLCTAAAQPLDLPFTTLARGATSAIGDARPDAELIVIRSRAALAALYAKLHAGTRHTSRTPQALEVDFAERMVVGVLLGLRRTGGYSVVIERVTFQPDTGKLGAGKLDVGKPGGMDARGGSMVVHATETRPAPGAMLIQALTQPYHLVTIPAKSGPVRLVLATRQE